MSLAKEYPPMEKQSSNTHIFIMTALKCLFGALALVLLCLNTANATEDWLGEDELDNWQARLSPEHFYYRPEADNEIDQLFRRVSTKNLDLDDHQPSRRILRKVGIEETPELQNIEVVPLKNRPHFQVPVRSNIWRNIEKWSDNPDVALKSGTTWGGSGGGSGLICAAARPNVRRVSIGDSLKQLEFNFRTFLKPRTILSADYDWIEEKASNRTNRKVRFEDAYAFTQLQPFRFAKGEPRRAEMLETLESQLSGYKKSLKDHWRNQSEDQIYNSISEWVKYSSPGFYYRWQLLKPQINWVPVKHIHLIPDSLFGGQPTSLWYPVRRRQKENKSIDRYIRISLRNGEILDCQKYQILLNRYEPTPKGRIPKVTIFYNQAIMDHYFSPLDRAIARLHEEWYVLANLQGKVSSEEVRQAIIETSGSYHAFKNKRPNDWIYYEDSTQGTLRKLLFPLKRLFSEEILSHRENDSKKPHFYTQLSVELYLRSENGLRSILNQISDKYSPEFQWDYSKTKNQNYDLVSSWMQEKAKINQTARGLLFNSQDFLRLLDTPEKAMVFMIDSFELTRGESKMDRRLENERVLNSPKSQKNWTLEQNLTFSEFCDQMELNSERVRKHYSALNDSTYNLLLGKTRSWCRNVLPELVVDY